MVAPPSVTSGAKRVDQVTFTTLRVMVRRTQTALRHYQETCDERDRVIRALLEQGNSTRAVAKAAGITQARVVQIHRAPLLAAEAAAAAEVAVADQAVAATPEAVPLDAAP